MALPDSEFCSDTVEEDEDLYDCVENEEAEGDEIYEDLMRSEPVPMPVCGDEEPGLGGGTGRGQPWVPDTCLSSLISAQDDRVRQAVLLPARDPADGGEVHGHAGLHPTGAMLPPSPCQVHAWEWAGRCVPTCPAPVGPCWEVPLFPLLCVSLSLFLPGFLRPSPCLVSLFVCLCFFPSVYPLCVFPLLSLTFYFLYFLWPLF